MNSNWGRWGADDEVGAFNLVDSKKVLSAAALIRTGKIVNLSQPMGPNHLTTPHRRRLARFMDRDAGDYSLGARSPSGFKFAEDTVIFPTHTSTHLDALSHVWSGDSLFNGFPDASTRSTKGATRLGADKLRPILTRGLLLDFASAHDAPLAPSTSITVKDLEVAFERIGKRPESGDAILIRTGWWKAKGGTADYFDLEPGLDATAARWLAEADVALVGADNYAIEVQPAPDGSAFPVHLVMLHQFGIPLLENLDLEELSESSIFEFAFVLTPLALEGSTASPVTPIALL